MREHARRETAIVAELPEIHPVAAKMIESSSRVYDTRPERAAMRCALGDAAHLCDALAREIRDARKTHGRSKKADLELAQQIELVGNAIWAMRAHVRVPGA